MKDFEKIFNNTILPLSIQYKEYLNTKFRIGEKYQSKKTAWKDLRETKVAFSITNDLEKFNQRDGLVKLLKERIELSDNKDYLRDISYLFHILLIRVLQTRSEEGSDHKLPDEVSDHVYEM